MPEIVVSAPKVKRAAGRSRRRAGARTAGTAAPPGAAVGAQGSGPGGNANSTAPLEQAPAMDKTGTKLADLPQSVVVVPRAVVTDQGGTNLSDAVHNVSGINLGGSSSYGFFDRFTIRGMDARIFSDQFPDGDQFNGFPHSMNGVQYIEVLKGPGSALFGSSTPGGAIDIVHFLPSAVPGYGISQQIGSFGSWTTSVYATGPTSVPGLTYRVDGLFQHSDGFRDLENADYELGPEFSWNHNNHVTTVAVDVRHIERTPDGYGILYFNGAALAGTPLTNVPNTAKYSTPFSKGDQDFQRSTVSDSWWIADYLTVNNRFSLMHRDVSILRNSGGGPSRWSMANSPRAGPATTRTDRSRLRRHLPVRADLEIPHRRRRSYAADRRADRMAEHRR